MSGTTAAFFGLLAVVTIGIVAIALCRRCSGQTQPTVIMAGCGHHGCMYAHPQVQQPAPAGRVRNAVAVLRGQPQPVATPQPAVPPCMYPYVHGGQTPPWAPTRHSHPYAPRGHGHPGEYSLANHGHDDRYAPIRHDHDQYVTRADLDRILAEHAATGGNHDHGYRGHWRLGSLLGALAGALVGWILGWLVLPKSWYTHLANVTLRHTPLGPVLTAHHALWVPFRFGVLAFFILLGIWVGGWLVGRMQRTTGARVTP